MDPLLNRLMSKREYRKWIICKAVEKRKVSAKYLAELCGCTSKTVLIDIQEINVNNSFAVEMPLIQNENNIICIDSTQKIPLNTIYREIIEASYPFKILNEIIENSKMTMGEFSKKNYLSYNPIYKAIVQLNSYLSLYDLRIIKFQLVGDEYKIRIFLFHFYWNLFGGAKWPFKKVSKKNCQEEVKILVQVFSTKLSWIENEKLCFWIAILIMRNKIDNDNNLDKVPIFWRNLDEKKYCLIEKIAINLPLKRLRIEASLLLEARYLIYEKSNLKECNLTLSNFNDSCSKVSARIIKRLIKRDTSEETASKIRKVTYELSKVIQYQQLGESYLTLAFKTDIQIKNITKLKIYPELLSISAEQSYRIIQVLEKNFLLKSPRYSIYIATKYDEVDFKRIKTILESESPDCISYSSFWNINEEVDVIITDLEELLHRKKGLAIQIIHPFDEKKASRIVKEIKNYFNV